MQVGDSLGVLAGPVGQQILAVVVSGAAHASQEPRQGKRHVVIASKLPLRSTQQRQHPFVSSSSASSGKGTKYATLQGRRASKGISPALLSQGSSGTLRP